MFRDFRELESQMSPERIARATARAEKTIAAMPLHVLREAQRLSQQELAELLDSRQASISRLENRSDMHVSTLRNYVEALGGTLELIARFPNGDVRIGPFAEAKKSRRVTARKR